MHEPLPKGLGRWGWLGELLPALGVIAWLGWVAVQTPVISDANTYQTQALLFLKGHRPYVNFIHSQGPFYLLTGALALALSGGKTWAMTVSSCLVLALAAGVALRLAMRVQPRPWVRGVAVAGLTGLVGQWGGVTFLGLAEMLLGLVVAMWAAFSPHWPQSRRVLLAGLGLGVALSCKFLAAPVAAGVLACLLWENRRLGVATVAASGLFFLLFTGWAWPQGGFEGWRMQVIDLQLHKNLRVVGLAVAAKNALKQLAPLFLVAALGVGQGKGRGQAGLFFGVVLGVWLAGQWRMPFVAYHYLLPPLLGLWWLGLSAGQGQRRWSRLAWLGVAVAAGWLTFAARPPAHADGGLPGLGAVCRTLRQNGVTGGSIWVDHVLSWPVVSCSHNLPWGGLTDTHFYIYAQVYPFELLMQRLGQAPPAALVMARDQSLLHVPEFRRWVKMGYRAVPQPKNSLFVVYLPR